MSLGLKRGEVKLCKFDAEWIKLAQQTISRLWNIFGAAAKDIQHIGSTAVKHIMAKPIIDIAVGAECLEAAAEKFPLFKSAGIDKSLGQFLDDVILLSVDAPEKGRTHNIQVVKFNSEQWNNHIALRDYLNAHTQKAREYERLKTELAKQYPNDISAYTSGKDAFIKNCLAEAKAIRCGKG